MCDPVLPEIIAVHQSGSRVNITYHLNISFPRTKVFCRFGLFGVRADFVSEPLISCVAPEASPGVVSLQISMDGLHWSRGDFHYKYRRQFDFVRILPLVIVYTICLILAIAVLRFVFVEDQGREEHPGETQPFLDPTGKRVRRRTTIRKRIDP
jgi:hypothetical protein